MKKRIFVVGVLAFILLCPSFSLGIPALSNPVVDNACIISPSTEVLVNSFLVCP